MPPPVGRSLVALVVCSLAGRSAVGGWDGEHRIRVLDQDDQGNPITVEAYRDGERVDTARLDGEGEHTYKEALTLTERGHYRRPVGVENGETGNTTVTLPPEDSDSWTTVNVAEDGRVQF